MKRLLTIAVALGAMFSVALAAGEQQKVTLDLNGVYCANCAKTLSAALTDAGAKLDGKLSPNRGRTPVRVVAELASDADLGNLGKTTNEAQTPHRSVSAPGVSLVLFAKLDKDSAAKALKAIGEVKGIDGKGSKADVEKGEIRVKLRGPEKVTVADVLSALKNAGIEASIAKPKA